MNQRKKERDMDAANRKLATSIEGLECRLAEPGRVLLQRGSVLRASSGSDTSTKVSFLFLLFFEKKIYIVTLISDFVFVLLCPIFAFFFLYFYSKNKKKLPL